MASWAQFETQAPELAEVAARLWPGVVALHRGAAVPQGAPCFAICYIATVRRDGGPRLHPFCPVLAGGRLFAAIPRSSPKGWDLRRDPRCVIHALPGPDDDEFCVRAVASEVTGDPAARALVCAVVGTSGVGGMIESVAQDPLFEFDLEQVDVARWVDIGQPAPVPHASNGEPPHRDSERGNDTAPVTSIGETRPQPAGKGIPPACHATPR